MHVMYFLRAEWIWRTWRLWNWQKRLVRRSETISERTYDTRRVCSTLYRPLDPSPRYLVGSSPHAGSLFATDNSVSVAGSRTKGYISKPLLNFPAFCTGSIIDFPRVSQRPRTPSLRLLSLPSPLFLFFFLRRLPHRRRSFFVARLWKPRPRE